MPYVERLDGDIVAYAAFPMNNITEYIESDEPEFVVFAMNMLEQGFDMATDYRATRKIKYPDAGDQFGMIVKALAAIKADGVDIGADGDALVAKVQAVKDAVPKP